MRLKALAILWISLACMSGHLQAQKANPAESEFVRVEAGQLRLKDQRYNFVAANSYLMLESRQLADQQLASLQAIGVKALRMWGFANGQAPQEARKFLLYNETPGQWPPRLSYPEEAWQQLDYVIKRAGELNIRLILPLGNYWDEYGGINMLAQWAGFPPETIAFHDREQFYRSERTREIYEGYVEHMMNRVNHLNGRAYRDDPTILMWEPLNEARGRSDITGKTATDWLGWAATTIKKYDPNHLVGSGTEGFLRSYQNSEASLPNFDYSQYPFQADRPHWVERLDPATGQREAKQVVAEGSYFLDDCSLPSIDVCSMHAWPYNWFMTDKQAAELFMEAWIKAHREQMRLQGIVKPLYLAEFGRQIVRNQEGSLGLRDRLFGATFQTARAEDIDGVGFWHISLARPEQLNGKLTFDVICNPQGAWDSTCQEIRAFTESMTSQ